MAPDAVRSVVPPPGPRFLGRRGWLVFALMLSGVWAFWQLGLAPGDVLPTDKGLGTAGEFLARAVTPALDHETDFKPETPLLVLAGEAALNTLRYAAAAMALALVVGLFLGFFGSTAWWAHTPVGGQTWIGRVLRRGVAPALYGAARFVAAFLRSIHEILWAMLFLLAFPTSDVTAIVAIACPFAGTLAKIFAEMVDEAPRGPALALGAAGAGGVQMFTAGLLPAALPDMTAYTFYRFECGLRSAAILGFFGFDTLGARIRDSFRYGHYGETWTFLYALLALIVLFDLWSGALRRRMVR